MNTKHLYRSRTEKMIAGVCGGIAQYFGIDPVMVRLIAVAALLLGIFPAIFAYVTLWIIVPSEPLDKA